MLYLLYNGESFERSAYIHQKQNKKNKQDHKNVRIVNQ